MPGPFSKYNVFGVHTRCHLRKVLRLGGKECPAQSGPSPDSYKWLASPLGRQTRCAHQLQDPEAPSQHLFPSPNCWVCADHTPVPPSRLQPCCPLLAQPMHCLHRDPLLNLQDASQASPKPSPTLSLPPHRLRGHTMAPQRGRSPPVPALQQRVIAPPALHPRLPAGQGTKENMPLVWSRSPRSQLPPPHWPPNTFTPFLLQGAP